MSDKSSKYKQYLPNIVRRKKHFEQYQPTQSADRPRLEVQPVYSVFHYDDKRIEEKKLNSIIDWSSIEEPNQIVWINIDGLRKDDVEQLSAHFKIHPLITEDILSMGQRAKMDEVDDLLFCLLPMIYFNNETKGVELEQVSIVTGHGFLLSFQEDAKRDVFDPLRERLRNNNLRIRERGADYLCYSLLDVIVDSYFGIIENLGNCIDQIEDKLICNQEEGVLADISNIRKEVMLMKRAIMPVRELVNGFLRSGNELIEPRNEKYFKDVSDHIIQANENCDSLRDMLSNLQDMYMNQINLRMNEVMKIFTMVSLLLAPATVIGGIFGMNFERIPLLHNQEGFYFSVTAMLLIPILMLFYFKRKKWF